MDIALKTAVDWTLPHVDIIDARSRGTVGLASDEYARLRKLREEGYMRPLAARLAILVSLGWSRTDIASAMDVSRVTLNNWLREHTHGHETFAPYFPGRALEGDPDSTQTIEVLAPVRNKLTPRNAEIMGGVKFEHDKFIVPDGFVPTLESLWRVAYRARGPELTTDAGIAGASDALDIMISLLLRRGVTNLAIAKAAGVTHRAVLDRMNRARHRGILLECGGDDSCESFHGENVVRTAFADSEMRPIFLEPGDWLREDDLESEDMIAIRITSARPSRYWLQTLVDLAEEDHPAMIIPSVSSGFDHGEIHSRLHSARELCRDDVGVNVATTELYTAALLGRMNEDSPEAQDIAKTARVGTMFVPASLLYTEAADRAGKLPVNSSEARQHIPKGLWDKYFAPHEIVLRCFVEPEKIDEEFSATAKHGPDAMTRAGASA